MEPRDQNTCERAAVKAALPLPLVSAALVLNVL